MVLNLIDVHPLGLRDSSRLKHRSLMLAEQNLLLLLVAWKLLWVLKVVVVVFRHLSHHRGVARSQVPLLMRQRRALILGVF